MAFRLIHAQLAHAPEVAALDQRCFPEDPWDPASWAAEVTRPGSILLVALGGGEERVVGFLLGWWVLDELEILKVGVHPDFRRHHIGQHFLERLEATPNIGTFFLEVREDNAGAIALYERAGYRQYGKRPRYYQDGCAALLYRKILSTG